MKTQQWIKAAGLVSGLVVAHSAQAVLVDLGPGSLTPAAAVIDFTEFPLGTVNPSITLPAGSLGNVTVSFAGIFQGQTVTAGFPVTLNNTVPTGPLALDLSVDSVTVNDGAPGATSPVLSGSPIFNGPIAVLFDVPVAAVGLKGGFFDAIGATTIEAFDITGASLGSIVNTVTGFEFYGLADSTGANVISGISFYITGSEPAGFQIDDLTFGGREVIVDPNPVSDVGATLGLMLLGLGGLSGLARRQR